MVKQPYGFKEYPNRKKLRQMYDARYNRKLTYDQFRSAVKRDIDRNNEQLRVENLMDEQIKKKAESTELKEETTKAVEVE